MKKFVLFFLIVSAIFTSCSKSPRDAANDNILALEKQLTEDTTMVLDKQVALDLTTQYANFADNFPADTLAPHYLFKAGEMAMNLSMGTKAIMYFNKIVQQYAGYKKMPETLFLLAFVYENQMNNEKMATELYQRFMDNYPDHVLYKDAKASLDNMGKSLEELIKSFEEKQAKKEVPGEAKEI
ncbi:MAG: tetratricopeptide repeat protein [Bacteroidales bacterium]|nr:tetratricopeptide repeat protein [Bacteroidales bacterium]MCF8458894.1 tetratricopeptide repeat protein [Bacteroidales bacterium]